MARTTKSVSRARTAERGASKKGTGKQAATRRKERGKRCCETGSRQERRD